LSSIDFEKRADSSLDASYCRVDAEKDLRFEADTGYKGNQSGFCLKWQGMDGCFVTSSG
jgi:hypothetical protein